MTALAEEAEARGKRYLVLVTGVPGAGKALVGLRPCMNTPPKTELRPS